MLNDTDSSLGNQAIHNSNTRLDANISQSNFSFNYLTHYITILFKIFKKSLSILT